ncbi:hypothetical protein A4X13_0g8677 [Tilletia indica]|uniref:Uncharacterized protein n=1 Tax=Tilletia indica TaxID=43049 RepID=A0A8T8SDI3_9BASI|nr:hypothetical protein A4X13_0g8677 [Tilletia indica]
MTLNADSNAVTSRVPGLTGVANYFARRRAMGPILTGYRALEIVQGSEPSPSMPLAPTSVELKFVEAWKERNAKAISHIQQTGKPSALRWLLGFGPDLTIGRGLRLM